MKTSQNILGILIHGRQIEVSDVERAGSSCKIRKYATYTLSDGIEIDTIANDAQKFKDFLKTNGFKAKRAVIGIPAKSIFSTIIDLPPINDDQLKHETIAINLERKIELNIDEVVFAYDQQQDSNLPDTLVLAVGKKLINQIKDFLKAVKITPVQIINASLMFRPTGTSDIECQLIEYEDTFELCLYRQRILVANHSISKETAQSLDAKAAGRITRYLSRHRLLLTGDSNAVTYKAYLQTKPDRDELNKVSSSLDNLQLGSLQNNSGNYYGDLCAELAQRALSNNLPAIDFINGRSARTEPSVIKQHLKKIAYSAAIVLAIIVAFALSWYFDKTEIANLQGQLDSIQQSSVSAKEMVENVGYCRKWFLKNPEYLEILRQLSGAFPESSDLWLTSFAIDESSNQILTGRTEDKDAVFDLAEKLRTGKFFEDIQIMYIRKMGKGTETMTFAIKLKCTQEI